MPMAESKPPIVVGIISWLSVAGKESATFKDNYAGDVSLNSVGFRVVRDLAN